MRFKYVLILVFFSFPQKLTMAQLRHLEIGIDATGSGHFQLAPLLSAHVLRRRMNIL